MRAIEWVPGTTSEPRGRVRLIDQIKLPLEEVFIETENVEVLAKAIRELRIRGAPAIGIAVGFGLVLAVQNARTSDELLKAFDRASSLLSSTRPTAANLFYSLQRMRHTLDSCLSKPLGSIKAALIEEAQSILKEDEKTCRRIGEHGASLVPRRAKVLTHCNTGALATGGEGTAQAVITRAASQGKQVTVYVDETRPLLQGARLAAWELMKAGIDVTLITDNTAAFLMQQNKIDLIVVGADRISTNGDVANKVGTYNLAVLAEKHRIPMYVAGPTSSIDFDLVSGDSIPIEERDPREVTEGFGRRIAPAGVRVYSPAFDVTPHELITAIITEFGILRPPYEQSIVELKEKRESFSTTR